MGRSQVRFEYLTKRHRAELRALLINTRLIDDYHEAEKKDGDVTALLEGIKAEHDFATAILNEENPAGFLNYWSWIEASIEDKKRDGRDEIGTLLLAERLCSKIHELRFVRKATNDNSMGLPKGKLQIFSLLEGKRVGNRNFRRIGPDCYGVARLADGLMADNGTLRYTLKRQRPGTCYPDILKADLSKMTGQSKTTVRDRLTQAEWRLPEVCLYTIRKDSL